MSSSSGKKGIKNEILRLSILGFNYNQIKEKLNCSKGTISYHLSKNVQEKKELKRENKKNLINEIINNLPKTRQIFDELYYDKLTKLEIQFFYNSFYKKPYMGTRKNNVPKEYYRIKRLNIKKELVDLKGGSCEICGYNKSLRALEFHHINPKDKDFNLSGMVRLTEEIKKELKKCMLVCSNCHAELHDLNL
jgi:DNA replicative helicase MCM subunit Mcm2 (Cdc46/Mcm family)